MTPEDRQRAEQRRELPRIETLAGLYDLHDADQSCRCPAKRLGRLAAGLSRTLGTEFSEELAGLLGMTYERYVECVRQHPLDLARMVLGLRSPF